MRSRKRLRSRSSWGMRVRDIGRRWMVVWLVWAAMVRSTRTEAANAKTHKRGELEVVHANLEQEYGQQRQHHLHYQHHRRQHLDKFDATGRNDHVHADAAFAFEVATKAKNIQAKLNAEGQAEAKVEAETQIAEIIAKAAKSGSVETNGVSIIPCSIRAELKACPARTLMLESFRDDFLPRFSRNSSRSSADSSSILSSSSSSSSSVLSSVDDKQSKQASMHLLSRIHLESVSPKIFLTLPLSDRNFGFQAIADTGSDMLRVSGRDIKQAFKDLLAVKADEADKAASAGKLNESGAGKSNNMDDIEALRIALASAFLDGEVRKESFVRTAVDFTKSSSGEVRSTFSVPLGVGNGERRAIAGLAPVKQEACGLSRQIGFLNNLFQAQSNAGQGQEQTKMMIMDLRGGIGGSGELIVSPISLKSLEGNEIFSGELVCPLSSGTGRCDAQCTSKCQSPCHSNKPGIHTTSLASANIRNSSRKSGDSGSNGITGTAAIASDITCEAQPAPPAIAKRERDKSGCEFYDIREEGGPQRPTKVLYGKVLEHIFRYQYQFAILQIYTCTFNES